MKVTIASRNAMLGMCGVLACLTMGGCNTTKATVDTTVNFFSSTTPNELFSDGMVVKEEKINLFAGVTYENLRQEAAAGGGQYVTALASLYEIPASKHQDFGLLLQRNHPDLFATGLEEDRTAHLKMVSALNRELAAGSLLP